MATEDGDELQAQRWLTTLARGWVVLLLGAVGGAALGWAASSRVPRLFEASGMLHLTGAPADTSGLFTMPAVRAILTGQTLAAEIVEEFGLSTPPHRLTPQRFLAEAYVVDEIPGTNLVRQRVRLLDPTLARRVANRTAERGVELVTQLWRESAEARRTQLERQVAQARMALEDADQRHRMYREQAGLVSLRREVDRLLVRPDTGGRARSPVLTELYAKDHELTRLETEIDTKRKVFIDIGARHEQLRIELDSTLPPLRLIDRPSLPDRPIPGNQTRTIALGLLAGLILGACATIAREWRDSGLRKLSGGAARQGKRLSDRGFSS